MKSKIKNNFKDGLFEYGTIQTKRNEKTKKKEGEEFNKLGELYFDYRRIRQEDYSTYHTEESKLDLKVETFFVPGVEKSHKVMLGEDIYNISGVDPSNDRTTLFWYLSKRGRFNP